MSTLFTLTRFFPYWAVPVAIIIAELGMHFKRKGSGLKFFCWGISALLTVMIVFWVGNRGDKHSDRWVKEWVGSN